MNKIDTSPEALRALADTISDPYNVTLRCCEDVAGTLRAVADEKQHYKVIQAQNRILEQRNQRLMQILVGIQSLLPPPPVTVGDNTYVFQDPNANETLRLLKYRIESIENDIVNAHLPEVT